MANWDERYRRGEHLSDVPLPLVVNAALQCSPGRALDLACGVGRHALWLAEHGWQVTAVDASAVAIKLLRQRAGARGVDVDARVADLERSEFVIEPGAYDLIVVTHYLQRDLFPAIRAGVQTGGLVIAVIALLDDDPRVKPMNPAFLLQPDELRAAFDGWELLHDFEGKPAGQADKRAMAEIIARRLV
jgi:tellurite methyltransferase